MKHLLHKICQRLGFDVIRHLPGKPSRAYPPDVSSDEVAILDRISGFTMTTIERQLALIQAVRHISRRGVPGCVVECGVWRGGSSMAAALTLLQEKDGLRDFYLYDTFEGMTPPQSMDTFVDGTPAQALLEKDRDKATWYWAVSGLDEVTRNMESTGYPREKVKYVKGPVEKTIPKQIPNEPIALLRLDTDWYESTRHELIHLFPRLVPGGILIIDDYGDWAGARKAVDEYFGELKWPHMMQRVDYSGRLMIKL